MDKPGAGPSTEASRRYLVFAQRTGVVSMTLGALVLAGWAFGIDALKSVLPGLETMKPNTAICFILLGFALWLSRKRSGRSESVDSKRHVVAQGCALVAAFVGLVSLSEHLLGYHAGIDELLFRKALLAAKVHFPGRMAQVTWVEFIILGISLILLNAQSRGSQRSSQIFALVAMVIGLISLNKVDAERQRTAVELQGANERGWQAGNP